MSIAKVSTEVLRLRRGELAVLRAALVTEKERSAALTDALRELAEHFDMVVEEGLEDYEPSLNERIKSLL